MQVKPHFKNYKILHKEILFKSDTGYNMCFVVVEAEIPLKSSSGIFMLTDAYKCTFATVIEDKLQSYNNGSLAYRTNTFYKKENPPKSFYKKEHEGIMVEEYEDGKHFIFCNQYLSGKLEEEGIKTSFRLYKK